MLWGQLTNGGHAGVDHAAVFDRIADVSRWSGRYGFMTLMSAGIAILGLLLSSPAVVIGAMLISPLMGPILGLGFALATFDFPELRRAATSLMLGIALAILLTVVIVQLSPLKAPTAEILARTRPNLFDLLVALFSALAGSYAIVRGRGETVAGVAIATALMPPLAVVGYGLATWRVDILIGSAELFGTNFVTIALSAMLMARLHGFGHALSGRQTWLQTGLLTAAFVAMAIPLALSLEQIAQEAITTNRIRTALADEFGPKARVTQLDIDYGQRPAAVQAVVIVSRDRAARVDALRSQLEKAAARPLTLQLDQVLVDPNAGAAARQRAEAAASQASRKAIQDDTEQLAKTLATIAGVQPDAVTIDTAHQRAVVAAAPLPGADLATYRVLEQRAAAQQAGWDVRVIPPAQPLPTISFPRGSDQLDDTALATLEVVSWAARRWNVPVVAVKGLRPTQRSRPNLVGRRAAAVAAALSAVGLKTVPVEAGDTSGPPVGDRPSGPIRR
jgi:uncharacterized hydrophobic protein (TIGR00271 family)